MDHNSELSYEQLKPFRCKQCSNSFRSKHSLKLHTNVLHSAGMFECSKCAFKCERYGQMNFHMQRHRHLERHSIPTDESSPEPSDSKPSDSKPSDSTGSKYQAKIPSLVIKLGKNRLRISQNSVTESQEDQQKSPSNELESEFKDQIPIGTNKTVHKSNGNFFCELCKKRFTQVGRFQKHMIIKHTEKKSVEIGSELDGEHIRCLVCHKLFASKGTLKRHILIHTGEMPFECKKCDAKYNQKIRLQQHMKKDHGEGLFKCNKCDESFIQSIHLQRHMVAHTGNKPFACKKCDASFAMHRDLKRHLILGHIQKKPFQCRKRGNKLVLKRFVSKSMKKNHTTININITVNSEVNSEEKYLNCMKCKERVKFSQLKSHMDMHQNAFRCDSCNRIFQSQHSLKIHRAKSHRENSVNPDIDSAPECESPQSEDNNGNQSHIDENQNSFKCEICNRICHSKRSLNIHRTKAHKEKIADTDLDLEMVSENSLSEDNNDKQSRIEINQNDFICEICNRICHSKRSLNIHKTKAHKENIANADLDLEPKNENSPSEGNVGTQSHNEINQNNFKCEICNKTSSSVHGLNIHKAKAHKETSNNNDFDLEPKNENSLNIENTDNQSNIDLNQNNLICEICNRICHSKRSLNIHKTKAHKEYSNDIKMEILPETSSEIKKEIKNVPAIELKSENEMQNSDLQDLKTEDKKWQVKSCEEGGKLKIKLQINSRES